MSPHDSYTLPDNSQQSARGEWFDNQYKRWSSPKHEVLRQWLEDEIKALRAYHDGSANTQDTAYAITRPISTSPVPSLGTYSDEIAGLTGLWRLLITAFMEWPSVRRPDLFALLDAIGKVPDSIHLGQATDDEDKYRLTWTTYPYFGLVWYESSSLQPGEIVRMCPNAAAVEKARQIFIEKMNLEVVFRNKEYITQDRGRIVKYIAKALEGTPDESVPNDKATAHEQIRLEFHIPAVEAWMRYAGSELARHVLSEEGGPQRLTAWEERLHQIAEEESDSGTKMAALSALEHMSNARESIKH